MQSLVPAVVLAAGLSSRMGRPKALLPCDAGGRSFLAAVIDSLTAGGVDDVIVVVRPHDPALDAELKKVREAGGARIRSVANAEADAGQLSSLLAGLLVADRPGVQGLLMIPVDMPFVQPATVSRLLAAFDRGGARIVRPVYRKAHGHPVIFSRKLFDELRAADPSSGARAVVRAHAAFIVDVDVDDPGVVSDVDTPHDYARLVGLPLA